MGEALYSGLLRAGRSRQGGSRVVTQPRTRDTAHAGGGEHYGIGVLWSAPGGGQDRRTMPGSSPSSSGMRGTVREIARTGPRDGWFHLGAAGITTSPDGKTARGALPVIGFMANNPGVVDEDRERNLGRAERPERSTCAGQRR